MEIDAKINAICRNINRDGLIRFDPRDISDITNRIRNKHLQSWVSIMLQLGEVISPYYVRKMIGARMRRYPTTYTFLAESQLFMENALNMENAICLMKECVKEYYRGEGYWEYKENNVFFPLPCNRKPSMPLYTISRCNNILARLGSRYGIKELIDISMDSAKYVFRNHIITKYSNEEESVSYYYNSDESTINVNAELVDWLVRLAAITKEAPCIEHISPILRMILREQNEDGSWFYYSKETMKRHGIKPVTDCHHTATTLYSLIHVYELCDSLDSDLKERLYSSIKKGMKFFYEHFFDKDGNGKTELGKVLRKASTMQYSEALVAIGEYLRIMETDDIQYDIKALAAKITDKIADLVEDDGSAPCDIKITPININNINWGNGAALFALCYYQKFLKVQLER